MRSQFISLATMPIARSVAQINYSDQSALTRSFHHQHKQSSLHDILPIQSHLSTLCPSHRSHSVARVSTPSSLIRPLTTDSHLSSSTSSTTQSSSSSSSSSSNTSTSTSDPSTLTLSSDVVIVGGGAGGLELACKLGRLLGAQKVTLVDNKLYHIWKPSLHEVAAGTLDIHQEGLSYEMLAHDNNFTFVYGPMTQLDKTNNTITVDAISKNNSHSDVEFELPTRSIQYKHLVLCVGSTSHHFGVKGAAEHTISLNTPYDAERFRLKLLKEMTHLEVVKVQNPASTDKVNIVIVGAGATGVELAAELRESSLELSRYGYRHVNGQHDINISIVEGGERILAPLPERVSQAATKLLKDRNINIFTGARVGHIEKDRVVDVNGPEYPAHVIVWAAGIRAPPFLASLNLPLTRTGQIEVNGQLQVQQVGAENIFALGDCAASKDATGKLLPPRAQKAHQEASYLYDILSKVYKYQAQGENDPKCLNDIVSQSKPFVYHDHGSLVSIGHETSVGNLMGFLFSGGKPTSKFWFVEGILARTMYMSLHLLHHQAVLGTTRTAILALARFLVKRATPQVKLH